MPLLLPQHNRLEPRKGCWGLTTLGHPGKGMLPLVTGER